MTLEEKMYFAWKFSAQCKQRKLTWGVEEGRFWIIACNMRRLWIDSLNDLKGLGNAQNH